MKIQEKIKELYFKEKYKQKQIAKELGVSNQYVSKILLNDEKYKKEKESRQKENKINHRRKTIEYIRNKRKINDIVYEQLKELHKQASYELSGRSIISNRAFRNWNSSIYRFSEKNKSYHLKRNIVTGFDTPKKINWRGF